MHRSNVLECGCYADAIPKENIMRWIRWPNAYGGAVLVNDHVSAEIAKLDSITVDGVRATVKRCEPHCPHALTLWFDGKWQRSHPGPHADPSYGLAA